MKPSRIFNVDSEKNKNKKYKVQLFPDGSATCECHDWQFRSNNNLWYQCKHIIRVHRHIKNKLKNN